MTTNIDRAVTAVNNNQFNSIRAAARFYEVNFSTLYRRLHGAKLRAVSHQHLQKLTPTEEEAVLQKVLDRSDRGFHCSVAQCQQIANFLLKTRLQCPPQISNVWYKRFLKRHSEVLHTRFTRPYDYQRARAEDPVAISEWIHLVQSNIARYGVAAEDIYNVDETGFLHGRIPSQRVLSRKTRRAQPPRRIQPGCRQYTTAVECISGVGVVLPPLIIFSGKSITDSAVVQALPPNWMYIESDNGWTSFDISFQWLQKVFEPNTRRTTSTHRILILDGHGSHLTVEFHEFCKEHDIIMLCMPPHSSHLLQPLDIAVFAPVKVEYGSQISQLLIPAANITKHEFIAAYAIARRIRMTPSTIAAGWRAAGLIPIDVQRVLEKLTITGPEVSQQRFTTPVEDNGSTTDQSSQLATPRNIRQYCKAINSAKKRLFEGQLSMNRRLELIEKSHSLVQHQFEIMKMDYAILAATVSKPRRHQANRVLSTGKMLSSAELESRFATLEDREQLEAVAKAARKATATPRRCGICKQTGHNKGNCEARFDPLLR